MFKTISCMLAIGFAAGEEKKHESEMKSVSAHAGVVDEPEDLAEHSRAADTHSHRHKSASLQVESVEPPKKDATASAKADTKAKADDSKDADKKDGEDDTDGGSFGSGCFSGDARVTTQSGPVSMSNLKTGDVVRTAAGFEPVVGFLHAEQFSMNFLELTLPTGTLPISAEHLVFKADGQAVRAETVVVGDELVSGVVSSIAESVRQGVYAPLTKSGTIMVEGTVTSAYAEVDHAISHLAMSPMRWLGMSSASPTATIVPAVPISA